MLHNLTRRNAILGLATMPLGVCTSLRSDTTTSPLQIKLNDLVFGTADQRQLAGASLFVRQRGQTVTAISAGHAAGLSPSEVDQGVSRRALLPTSKMRIASVSKLGVTLAALSLSDDGMLDLHEDVGRWWPELKHPDYPDEALTLAQLLSHRSSVIDPPEYWVAAPERIDTLLTSSIFANHRPGTWFDYCNLNYGLAATILERASGERFDRLVRDRVLSPLGISGGYNWSGVSADERAAGASLYRLVEGEWAIQVDGPDMLRATDPILVARDTFSLADYDIGSNGTLFSPQGGLRASVEEMALLARALRADPRLTQTLWRFDPEMPNGNDWDGVFKHVGLGTFIWEAEDSPMPGYKMIGHDGEAYGLYSGAWTLPALDAEISFAVTGTPDGAQPAGTTHPAYNRWAEQLFALAAKSLGV